MTATTITKLEPASEPIHFKDRLYLYKSKDGIIVSEYYGNFELDLDLALEVKNRINDLTGGKRAPQLFIASIDLSVSKEVREWGATEDAYAFATKSAIISNTLGQRIIANFLIKVQRPPRPTRLFSNIDDAVKWLVK